ncbi:ABC transporter substrate-binding protein [Microlunatus soli]|uniref:Carbohydrate ABC transporter substrate-binding protein, CUT1 family n=1 Tax=Microlunatus soli TaxID=630515 RepID=A0A1H1ZBQ3_9ACTN|nr:sugar ABC transporter substrate-binding protein [Microlunatus soli]SDT30987.1 carbohydrate ABC transporter substrate-binding protein, CUT1 family [Microlunatus soli]
MTKPQLSPVRAQTFGRRHALGLLGAGAGTAFLAACSPNQQAEKGSGAGSGGAKTTVGFRLWDEKVAEAYQRSFAAFSKDNPDITVKINVVPWANYWEQLPIDVGGGTVDDLFWTNSTNFTQYADAGKITDIATLLGEADDDWQQSLVEQYTYKDKLWAVPQVADANGIFYNKTMLDEAGVDPTKLTWRPGGGSGDTLLPALKKLTKDSTGKSADDSGFNPKKLKVYGHNAAYDLQGIYFPFLASNGGKWQADGSNKFVFGSDQKTVQAFQYLIDLINKHHVAPSAADTNDNGDFSRDQFLQGNLAIFESGTYNLSNVADGTKFEWGVTANPAGPAGSYGVASGVGLVASSATKNTDAVKKVLKWLGSEDGNAYIGESGSALPAVTSAQEAWVEHWKGKGIDVQPFVDAAAGKTIQAPKGTGGSGSQDYYEPILKEIFLGRTPVKSGLAKAEKGANAAIGK